MNIQAAENATYYYVGFVLHNSCIGRVLVWKGWGGPFWGHPPPVWSIRAGRMGVVTYGPGFFRVFHIFDAFFALNRHEIWLAVALWLLLLSSVCFCVHLFFSCPSNPSDRADERIDQHNSLWCVCVCYPQRHESVKCVNLWARVLRCFCAFAFLLFPFFAWDYFVWWSMITFRHCRLLNRMDVMSFPANL